MKMGLNLGCGEDYRVECVNVDLAPWIRADVTWDLRVTPWPFASERFSHIVAYDVIEHLPSFIAFFNEAWRVLIPGGDIEVRTPHYQSEFVALDPTHIRGYHPETFDYLDPEKMWGRKYVYTQLRWKVLEVRVQPDSNIIARLEKRV